MNQSSIVKGKQLHITKISDSVNFKQRKLPKLSAIYCVSELIRNKPRFLNRENLIRFEVALKPCR